MYLKSPRKHLYGVFGKGMIFAYIELIVSLSSKKHEKVLDFKYPGNHAVFPIGISAGCL